MILVFCLNVSSAMTWLSLIEWGDSWDVLTFQWWCWFKIRPSIKKIYFFTGEACSKGRSDPVIWLLIGLNHGYLHHVVVNAPSPWSACTRSQYVTSTYEQPWTQAPHLVMTENTQDVIASTRASTICDIDLQAILYPSTSELAKT